MEEQIQRALAHVRDRSVGEPVSSHLRITLNFHPDVAGRDGSVIEALARDGLYRSQFETGISNGGLTAHRGGERWVWESRIFGGAYDGEDLPEASRPKYGALNYRSDTVGGSPRFGSCHLRLRSHVLARTTFCYPDSHLQPEHFGVAGSMGLIALAVAKRSEIDPLDDYIEAHVHGPLRIADDVEAVVLDPCYAGTLIEEAALSIPCAIEWHGGFRLSLDDRDDCERYRGSAAAEAIVSLGGSGPITPLHLGKARAAGMDRQLAKWIWHCIARFGRPGERAASRGGVP